MIVYGSGLSDGNRHTHEDLPVLVAGRAGHFIKPGRRIVYRKETPMADLSDCLHRSLFEPAAASAHPVLREPA